MVLTAASVSSSSESQPSPLVSSSLLEASAAPGGGTKAPSSMTTSTEKGRSPTATSFVPFEVEREQGGGGAMTAAVAAVAAAAASPKGSGGGGGRRSNASNKGLRHHRKKTAPAVAVHPFFFSSSDGGGDGAFCGQCLAAAAAAAPPSTGTAEHGGGSGTGSGGISGGGISGGEGGDLVVGGDLDLDEKKEADLAAPSGAARRGRGHVRRAAASSSADEDDGRGGSGGDPRSSRPPAAAAAAAAAAGEAAEPTPAVNEAVAVVRSTLAVSGMCCASEVPAVRRCLKAGGALKIRINLAAKRVYVEHASNSSKEASSVSASRMARNLTEAGFPSAVVEDGAAAGGTGKSLATTRPRKTVRRSAYVETTLKVSNLSRRHVSLPSLLLSQVVRNLPDSGGGGGGGDRATTTCAVRAVRPHLNSGTVKVEHDPAHVSASEVCDLLAESPLNLDARILLDGGAEKMYLPATDDDEGEGDEEDASAAAVHGGSNGETSPAAPRAATTATRNRNHHQHPNSHEDEWKSERLQVHVALSGVFWFVSLLAEVEGWDRLVYAGLLSVAFGLPTVALKAIRTLRQRRFDANCMMVLAALGSVALGEFDEAASVSFLFSISEYLESRATERARRALSEICHLRPSYATLVDPETRQVRTIVPASSVAPGSLISVRTGDKVAADGVVVEGTSAVDESSLTGESRPVHKAAGSAVCGGSMNVGNAQLIVRTTSTVEDSALSRLIRLVEEAQTNTSPTEKMIDGFARVYTPVVVVMAAVMATIPWAFGVESGRHWTLNALIIVVVACPCALTISTPVTYAAGLAAAAQRGVVVKGGTHLEALGSVDKIVFDKTGTLTEGNFEVVHLEEIGSSRTREDMLRLLAAMEAPSSHPLSATLVKAAEREGVFVSSGVEVREHRIIKGEGVEVTVAGKQAYVGNRRLFERIGMFDDLERDVKIRAEEWECRGGTVGFLGVQGEGIVGAYCMIDSVRPEAKEAIEALQFSGFEVIVLTGDGRGAALAVANQVGLPETAVHSQLLPEDKLHFVGSLKRPAPKNTFSLFRRQRKVLFCGDGVNDAPALAVADVGVSMGEGAAVSMEMSDVTLMDSNLSKLVYAMKMGTRVMYTVRENILISLICKLLVVALTFAGYMTLMYAILSDVGVMLLVTFNGMKLLPGSPSDESPLMPALPTAWRRRGSNKYDVIPASTTPSGSTIAEIV